MALELSRSFKCDCPGGVDEQEYLEAQLDKREIEIIEIKISDEQEENLVKILKELDPNIKDYDVLSFSCVTCVEKPLKQAAILPNDPGPVEVDPAGTLLQAGSPHSFTPESLADQIKENKLVKRQETIGEQKVSKTTAFFNTVRRFFTRLFGGGRTSGVPPGRSRYNEDGLSEPRSTK